MSGTDEPTETTGAVEYHERTKHSPEGVRETDFSLDYDNKPRPYKVYRDLPTRPLADRFHAPQVPALSAVAEPRRDPTVGDAPAADTDLAALTACCFYSNGITKSIERRGEELLFRAAACTGKLYHVDCYAVTGDLAAPGPGDGLPAGVYHFDPRSFSLSVLRTGDHRGVLAAAAGAPALARAPVTFVATSTWWRNAWKYRERTFRHAFWDSGTVLANLLATAHALDLPASVVTAFADDAVADLVGVDPEREAPLELVPVGVGDPTPDPSPTGPVDVAPIHPETEPLSPEEEAYPLIHAAWRAGVLPDGEAAAGWRSRARRAILGEDSDDGGTDPGDGPRGIGRRPFGDGERVPLDPVDAGTASARPLAATVRRRGSCREYRRRPISFRKLSTVLDRSFRGVPTDVTLGDPAPTAERGGTAGVGEGSAPPLALNDAYLLVNDVAGLPGGGYHYRPETGELEALTQGEFRREAGHLALGQSLGHDAAVCVYLVADVERVVEALGDRGYRAAGIEAAVTAGRLYLAAYAHRDLGASGLTFFDDEVTDFFAPRAAGQTPTFLLTIGRPA